MGKGGPANNPETAPQKGKYPTGKAMKKGTKLKCMGCKDGKTAQGLCGACQGTGNITI